LEENQGFRAFQLSPQEAPSVCDASEPSSEGATMGKKWLRNFAESGDFHVTFGFFYMPLSTTWDRRLYFLSEVRYAEDFFARKIQRLRPGLNSRNWVQKARTLPLDHRNRCVKCIIRCIKGHLLAH
jgi:hypothetical protein